MHKSDECVMLMKMSCFQADRTDVEDQPTAKRRLLSAVVKVRPGTIHMCRISSIHTCAP